MGHSPRLCFNTPFWIHALWFHKRFEELISRGQSQQETGIDCVVTAAASWSLLHERFTLIQADGGLLVLFAVFIANFPPLREPPEILMVFSLNSRA
jgi:hypothetical protein